MHYLNLLCQVDYGNLGNWITENCKFSKVHNSCYLFRFCLHKLVDNCKQGQVCWDVRNVRSVEINEGSKLLRCKKGQGCWL